MYSSISAIMTKNLESSQEFCQLTHPNHKRQQQLVRLASSQRMKRTAITSVTVIAFLRKGEGAKVLLALVRRRIRLAANNIRIKALQLAWARQPTV